MKRISGLIICFLLTYSIHAQLKSHVDERFELTSIAFRLAGAEEYVNNQVVSYASDIDAYFALYQNHKLIQYIKKIREQDEIAFDAVSGSTFLLEIKNHHIQLKPQTNLKEYLQKEPRWKKETLEQYVKLLNQFYKDTKFNSFYKKHQSLYQQAEQNFNTLLASIHTEWFQSFYGKSLGNPAVYISLSNGRSNYSFKAYNNTNDFGIIIGCSRINDEGTPVFDANPGQTILLIIHEFSHYFSNPLVFKYEQEMIVAAEKIFPYIRKSLNAVGYDSAQTLLIEGFNQLFTNMYFEEYPDPLYGTYRILTNERSGFIWMRRAMKFMGNFVDNRDLYPHIDAFMPQLISFINLSGNQIEIILDEYNHSYPYVKNVFPVPNSVVSADIKEMRVYFSHPMKAYGTTGLKNPDIISPRSTEIPYINEEDRTCLIIPVQLKPNQHYGLVIPAGCQSEECFSMKENFEIIFKTEE
jgi:hypothetical protein